MSFILTYFLNQANFFGQLSGLHLEPSDERDRSEVERPHRRRPLHRLPPDGEHHRVGVARKRQNDQTLEKRNVNMNNMNNERQKLLIYKTKSKVAVDSKNSKIHQFEI